MKTVVALAMPASGRIGPGEARGGQGRPGEASGCRGSALQWLQRSSCRALPSHGNSVCDASPWPLHLRKRQRVRGYAEVGPSGPGADRGPEHGQEGAGTWPGDAGGKCQHGHPQRCAVPDPIPRYRRRSQGGRAGAGPGHGHGFGQGGEGHVRRGPCPFRHRGHDRTRSSPLCRGRTVGGGHPDGARSHPRTGSRRSARRTRSRQLFPRWPCRRAGDAS